MLTAAIADWERSHAAVRACGANAPAPWERIRYFTVWAPSAIALASASRLADDSELYKPMPPALHEERAPFCFSARGPLTIMPAAKIATSVDDVSR